MLAVLLAVRAAVHDVLPAVCCLWCRYASFQMALCAVPAVIVMNLGPHSSGDVAAKLQWVWLGLSLVMGFRAVSIWAPYKLRLPPFRALLQQHPKQQQQQQAASAQGAGKGP
jgi:hypothetical protein